MKNLETGDTDLLVLQHVRFDRPLPPDVFASPPPETVDGAASDGS
jgi:hypothetical protein